MHSGEGGRRPACGIDDRHGWGGVRGRTPGRRPHVAHELFATVGVSIPDTKGGGDLRRRAHHAARWRQGWNRLQGSERGHVPCRRRSRARQRPTRPGRRSTRPGRRRSRPRPVTTGKPLATTARRATTWERRRPRPPADPGQPADQGQPADPGQAADPGQSGGDHGHPPTRGNPTTRDNRSTRDSQATSTASRTLRPRPKVRCFSVFRRRL